MGTYTQFSVFLANKPGMLSQVCRALAEAKVNLLKLGEHGREILDRYSARYPEPESLTMGKGK